MRVLQVKCDVFMGAAEVGLVIVECVCVFFFAVFGVFGRLGASGEFLVVLRERRLDFLGPTNSFVSSGLVLLLGRWRNWRWGRVTRGRGFKCGRSVIVSWLEARKGV